MNQKSVFHILAIALLVTLGLNTTSIWLPTIQPVHAQGFPASIFVDPQNVTDPTKIVDSSVSMGVSVSEAPSLNAFSVILFYNTTVFRHCKQLSSGMIINCPVVDYSGNALGSDATTVLFCIDGFKQSASVADCPSTNHVGVISLSLVINGRVTDPILLGSLFRITFTVASLGFAQLHLYNATLITATSTTAIPTNVQHLSTQDGFFTNVDCPVGSGAACRPPTVRVSYSPNPAPKNTPVTFNATVKENNNRAAPLSYTWNWGDGTQPDVQSSSSTNPFGTIEFHVFQATSLGRASQCVGLGLCAVSLTVYDNETVSWTTTILVNILNIYTKLTVDVSIKVQNAIAASSVPNVVPGTPVQITAYITNVSNIVENATLTINLENTKLLGSGNFSLPSVGGTGSLNATWDTTNYAPRAYQIIVRISSVVSAKPVAGSLLRTQNDTSRNVESQFVLLVPSLVTGSFSLGLLQTTGLAIVILAAIAAGVARFVRKPSYMEEPL